MSLGRIDQLAPIIPKSPGFPCTYFPSLLLAFLGSSWLMHQHEQGGARRLKEVRAPKEAPIRAPGYPWVLLGPHGFSWLFVKAPPGSS